MKAVQVIAFSSVKADYFARICGILGHPVRLVCVVDELAYRSAARRGIFGQWFLRVKMYITYPLLVCWEAYKAPAAAVLLVSSNTFFAPLCAWLASRERRPLLIHWLYDLYPDALEVSGVVRRDSWFPAVAGEIQRCINRTADGVVYLGEFLRNHGEARWGPARWSTSIEVASDETLFSPEVRRRSGKIVIHYGGQLGRMHDAHSLAACVNALGSAVCAPVKFDFRISGAQRDYFAQSVLKNGWIVMDALPSFEWRQQVVKMDIGLVSLSPGGASVCLPSKSYAMMAAGLAIIAICPAWSDLARLVLNHGCGWVVNNSPYQTREELLGEDYYKRINETRPEDEVVNEFVVLIARLMKDSDELLNARARAVSAAMGVLGEAALRERWREAIQRVSFLGDAERLVQIV